MLLVFLEFLDQCQLVPEQVVQEGVNSNLMFS